MKILHLGKFYAPFFGGIERVNYDIVESLNCETDFQLDELCFCHNVNSNEKWETSYKLIRVPIRGIKFSMPIPKGYFRIYKNLRNSYDIVHIHVPNPLALLAPLLFPGRPKIIVHWHSDILKQKFLVKFLVPFQNMLLKKATKIIATSKNYAYNSDVILPFKDKVEIVPIGIDTDYLTTNPEDIKEIRNTYKGKKIILSIGRLTYYKGFSFLIEAAQNIPDDSIILIGGSGELRNTLEEQIKELGVENKVKLIGRISDSMIGAYFEAADLFCLPSQFKTEAFGVVLIEALSKGLPIVACDIPGSGVPWVNQNNVTGFNVPINNSLAISNKITEILSSPDLQEKFSKNAKERYESLFTKKVMVKKIADIYREIGRKMQ